jgi:hypothetical protein
MNFQPANTKRDQISRSGWNSNGYAGRISILLALENILIYKILVDSPNTSLL